MIEIFDPLREELLIFGEHLLALNLQRVERARGYLLKSTHLAERHDIYI